MKNIILFIQFMSFILFASDAFALREPRSTSTDERIKIMIFNPNDVFKFTGFYGFQSSIEFGEGETVETISMGDTLAWQIVPSGKRVFIKPMEPDATTNMTLITNKRTYFFELHAKEATDINDPEMVFAIRFMYPDEGSTEGIMSFAQSSTGPDIEYEPEKYNFNYSISGDDFSAPLKIFDDGEFTYFQFRDKNAEIPAFFLVDAEKRESLVNYSIQGEYVVVQRVGGRFTLRNGNYVTCIFNESNSEGTGAWYRIK